MYSKYNMDLHYLHMPGLLVASLVNVWLILADASTFPVTINVPIGFHARVIFANGSFLYFGTARRMLNHWSSGHEAWFVTAWTMTNLWYWGIWCCTKPDMNCCLPWCLTHWRMAKFLWSRQAIVLFSWRGRIRQQVITHGSAWVGWILLVRGCLAQCKCFKILNWSSKFKLILDAVQ